MKRAGALAMLMVLVCAPAAARTSHGRDARGSAHRAGTPRLVLSPDQRCRAEVTARGGLRVNGQLIRSVPGRVLGLPVWRQDSGALALLTRARYRVQLVVLPDLKERRPLVYQLPVGLSTRLRLFWISARRVGIGVRPLVPQVAVSWTTMLATAD